jgi:hypothetical protein
MNKEQLLVEINNINLEMDRIKSLLKTVKSKTEFDFYFEKLASLEATLEDLEDDLDNIEFSEQNEQNILR